MSDNINHPAHYETGQYECIKVMQEVFGTEAVKHFCQCNAFKYIWRMNRKNGDEDAEKADWYLNKYLELEAEYPVKPEPDTVSLVDALCDDDIWKDRLDNKVKVTMTYTDLKIICEMLKEKERSRRDEQT